MSISCFQKVELGDIIYFGSEGQIDREYLVISSFDGYKVKAVNLQTYRVGDICIDDLCYLKKIVKSSR